MAAGMYSSLPYTLAKCLVELPFVLVDSIIYRFDNTIHHLLAPFVVLCYKYTFINYCYALLLL